MLGQCGSGHCRGRAVLRGKVDAHVAKKVGGVQLRDVIPAARLDGRAALHHAAVEVKSGVLEEGGLEERKVIAVEGEDGAVDRVHDCLAEGEGGEGGWEKGHGLGREAKFGR